jgi:hypothetical protein
MMPQHLRTDGLRSFTGERSRECLFPSLVDALGGTCCVRIVGHSFERCGDEGEERPMVVSSPATQGRKVPAQHEQRRCTIHLLRYNLTVLQNLSYALAIVLRLRIQ